MSSEIKFSKLTGRDMDIYQAGFMAAENDYLQAWENRFGVRWKAFSIAEWVEVVDSATSEQLRNPAVLNMACKIVNRDELRRRIGL